jgi:hypothetical protein
VPPLLHAGSLYKITPRIHQCKVPQILNAMSKGSGRGGGGGLFFNVQKKNIKKNRKCTKKPAIFKIIFLLYKQH